MGELVKRLCAGLVLAYLLSGCSTGIVRPFPPSPPIPNAPITQAPPITHIPTRTLTPFPETPTWIPTETQPPHTPTFTFTATATATIAPTNTASPSLTPISPTVAATPTPILPLPSTGGQPNQTPTPSACKYYSLQLGLLGDDIVIYLKCVKDVIGNEVS